MALIAAAARLSKRLVTCPCKKNNKKTKQKNTHTKQLKHQLDILCAINDSEESLAFYS